MKVKFADKIYDVLYTMKFLGKPIYAVEDEPNHIDWLVNVEVIDEEKSMKVYRVENEAEQKGLWRKFDGTYEPLFDMLTDGQCRDLPMEDSPVYREGGKRWFASAPSKETLQKWFSKRDLEELVANGFTISEFEVVGYKKVSDFEYIFTRDNIINRNYLEVSDIYPEQKYIPLKFNVGDWIVYNNTICKIYKTSPDDKFYHCSDINDNIHIYNRSLENKFHSWTIQDAKDGDILWHSDSASNGIFIFKEIRNDGKILCYCDYDSEDHFCLGEHHTCCWTSSKYVKPAIKEQRDLLFAKMREAGFEWNEEKKELINLKEKSENYKQQLLSEMTDLIKDYIQQKPIWTEEDEKKRNLLIKILEVNHPHGLFKINSSETIRTEELVSWLKSLIKFK